MAQNRKNDDFDLSEFDDLLGSSHSGSPDGIEGFDIFNFSSADLDVSGLGRVQDDLDLDSFLNFDDLTEPQPEPEPELTYEPEPVYESGPQEQTEPEEDPLRQIERSQRRARKEAAFAELFGEKPQEEPDFEPESETPPKAKKRGGKRRRREEAEEPVEEALPTEPESEQSEPVEEEASFFEPESKAAPKAKKRGGKRRRREEAEPVEQTLPTEPESEQSEPVEQTEAGEELLPDEDGEPEYEPPKKRGLFSRRKRERLEENPQDEAEDTNGEDPAAADELAPEAGAAPEAAAAAAEGNERETAENEPEDFVPRRGFFARFLKPYEPGEETEDTAEDEPQESEKPSLFRNLFAREKQENDTDEAEAEEPDEEEKPAGGKISFFARLTPEKEKFQAIMQAKKEEERDRRRTELVRADNTSMAARAGREVRRGEELVYDSELDEIAYIDRDDLPESRDYLPIRFRRYGRSGIGGGLMYAAFVISVSILLACFGWLCAADVLALSKDEVSAVIVVESYVPSDTDTLNEDGEPVDERGDEITCDVDQVATALKEGEIINFKFLFKLFAKLSHASAKIDPGTYDVSTKLDYRALITEMQTGSDSQQITKITFPEGYRMEQVFELLDENDICDYDDLMEAAAYHNYAYSWLDESWYYDSEGDPRRLEGYLFPDTYEFYQGENAINVINRFLLRFHGLLTQDMYQQADNLGISLHEAVIVASLIEKEAGANDDRANFSSAIYNRLNAGWKLQLDSTVNYVNNTSTFSFYYDDLETDSPYNTYVYEGLPKGPICSPGLASLNAALQPNSTDYWFWFAYDGSTYFFTNETDFNAFAEQYRDY